MEVDLLRRVVTALEASGIPYMITGSVVSAMYGEPRATRDLDLVIDPNPTALEVFLAGFSSDRFYIDDAQAALADRDMFKRPRSGRRLEGRHADGTENLGRWRCGVAAATAGRRGPAAHPLDRRAERVDGGGIAPTYILWHLARHHDVAVNCILRQTDEVVEGYTLAALGAP